MWLGLMPEQFGLPSQINKALTLPAAAATMNTPPIKSGSPHDSFALAVGRSSAMTVVDHYLQNLLEVLSKWPL